MEERDDGVQDLLGPDPGAGGAVQGGEAALDHEEREAAAGKPVELAEEVVTLPSAGDDRDEFEDRALGFDEGDAGGEAIVGDFERDLAGEDGVVPAVDRDVGRKR